MGEKIVGYLLLLSGVAVILFSGLSVYNSFSTGKVPINIFQLKSISINPTQMVTSAISQKSPIQIPTSENPNEGNLEIIPGETLSLMANLAAYVALMTFVLNLGGRIASLGIQLLRPLQIKNVGA